jgi:hypothetical protein
VGGWAWLARGREKVDADAAATEQLAGTEPPAVAELPVSDKQD